MSDTLHHPEIRLNEDVVPFYIFTFIAVVILIIFGGIAWAWLLYHDASERMGGFLVPAVMERAPREISGVNQTLMVYDREGQRIQARQHEQLRSWGWVDEQAQIVHIPIEEAMRILIEESRNE